MIWSYLIFSRVTYGVTFLVSLYLLYTNPLVLITHFRLIITGYVLGWFFMFVDYLNVISKYRVNYPGTWLVQRSWLQWCFDGNNQFGLYDRDLHYLITALGLFICGFPYYIYELVNLSFQFDYVDFKVLSTDMSTFQNAVATMYVVTAVLYVFFSLAWYFAPNTDLVERRPSTEERAVPVYLIFRIVLFLVSGYLLFSVGDFTYHHIHILVLFAAGNITISIMVIFVIWYGPLHPNIARFRVFIRGLFTVPYFVFVDCFNTMSSAYPTLMDNRIYDSVSDITNHDQVQIWNYNILYGWTVLHFILLLVLVILFCLLGNSRPLVWFKYMRILFRTGFYIPMEHGKMSNTIHPHSVPLLHFNEQTPVHILLGLPYAFFHSSIYAILTISVVDSRILCKYHFDTLPHFGYRSFEGVPVLVPTVTKRDPYFIANSDHIHVVKLSDSDQKLLDALVFELYEIVGYPPRPFHHASRNI